MEELLDLAIEVSGEFEREFERWVVAVAFDSIDCLAGDADCIREVTLMAILWWWLDARERTVAFPFRSPSATEVGWTLTFVPLGFIVVTLVTEAIAPLGFTFTRPNYDLTDLVTAAGVLVGPLLLAPIFEEALVGIATALTDAVDVGERTLVGQAGDIRRYSVYA